MPSPGLADFLAPRERLLRLLWIAMTLSIAAYAALAWILGDVAPDPTRVPLALRRGFAAAAVALAATSFAVPRLLLPDARLRRAQRADPTPEELARDPRTGGVDPARREAAAALPAHERRLLGLAAPTAAALLVRLALHESIALLGLVLALLGQAFSPILPYALGAFALNLLVPPRLGPLLERAQRLQRDGSPDPV